MALSFARPADRAITRTVKLLEYEQAGSFDYTATMKPASFYGSEPASTPDPIPLNYIDAVQLAFSYASPDAAGQAVQVNAILESPGAWKKTVNLVPPAAPGLRNVSFPLDFRGFQLMADNLSKEIGAGGANLDLTVQAIVPGGATSLDGERIDFMQELPIKLTRTFLTIGGSLTGREGRTTGRFDYEVRLKDNGLYGPITLKSPAPSSQPPTVLGSKDTVFLKLVDTMNVSYSYHLTAGAPVSRMLTEVKVDAVVTNPDKWSRTYTILPSTRQSGDFTVSVPLDLHQVSDVFDTIQQDFGVPASAESLALRATVHTTGQTDQGPIDETFTQTIETDLRGGVLTWKGDMQKNQPGAIEASRTVTEPVRLLGRPIVEMRIISSVAAVLLLAVLGFVLRAYRRTAGEAPVAGKARDIGSKYKAMIVEVTDLPELRAGETVLPVESVEDLIKVGQGLLKPVNHAGGQDSHVYWVYDDTKRYEYRLSNGKMPASTDQVE